MSGRVQEDAERRARLVLRAGRADRHDLRLGRVEVGDHHVEVELLGTSWLGQVGATYPSTCWKPMQPLPSAGRISTQPSSGVTSQSRRVA